MLGFAAAAAQALPRWHIAAAAAMAALSFQRTMVWRTEASLWSEAVQRAPGKARPKIQLARAVGGEEAWRLMEEAKKAAPEDAAVASEYGAMWLKANQPARALEEFGRAAALRPQDAGAINNRGTALEALGQTEAAKDDYRRALGMNPCLAEARENLERLGERPAAGARCQ
jgi:Flp pilus assembly protein TadD